MKKIVKLLIVLIVLCGLGFVIYKVVDKPETLNMNEYVSSQNEKINKTNGDLTNIKAKFNTTGENYSKVSLESNLFEEINSATSFYFDLLGDIELDKNDIKKIKSISTKFESALSELDEAITSLDNYLKLENKNDSEIFEREKKICEKLEILNNLSFELNENFGNICESKIFAGKSFDLGFKLVECKTMMIKSCKNAGGNNFAFLTAVENKISDFFANNQNANNEMIKFVILFNNFEKSDWQHCFDAYFESGNVASYNKISQTDFNNLLNCLNKESYYEKV